MTVSIPERLYGEVINLLSREYEKQIDERLSLEKKLSDARYALDIVNSKLKASQTEADELHRQIAELKNDDF